MCQPVRARLMRVCVGAVQSARQRPVDLAARERVRAADVEEWIAEQFRTGAAQSNPNFVPLPGDWRERVRARAAMRAAAAAAAAAAADAAADKANALFFDSEPDLGVLSVGLPEGWRALWDPGSKGVYYGHVESKVRLPRAGVTANAAITPLAPPPRRPCHRPRRATCVHTVLAAPHAWVCVPTCMSAQSQDAQRRWWPEGVAAATRMAGLFAAREGAVDAKHAMTRGSSIGCPRVLKEYYVHMGLTAAEAITEPFHGTVSVEESVHVRCQKGVAAVPALIAVLCNGTLLIQQSPSEGGEVRSGRAVRCPRLARGCSPLQPRWHELAGRSI